MKQRERGMPTDPPKSYQLDDTNGSGRFDEGDDLKPKLKRTLGSFLSELTKTQPTRNSYEIAPDLAESASFNEVTENTPSILTGNGSGEPVFTDDVVEAAKAYFESISQGDYGGGSNPLIDLFDKTLRAAQHGEKIAEIPGGTEAETPIQSKISAVLENNRFNPGGRTPYINNGALSKPYGRTQKRLGEYVPEGQNGAADYSVEDLTKVAFSLLLKSTGRLQSDDDPTAFDSGTILTTTGGEGVQVATVRVGNEKVGAGELLAANAFGAGAITRGTDSNADIRDPEIVDKAGFFQFETPGASFGQMYSHLEPFAPFGPFSPSPIALLLPQFVTIAASTAAVGLLLGLLTPGAGFKTADAATPTDVLKKGQSRKQTKAVGDLLAGVRRSLGIPDLENPFTPSVFVGLIWFQVSALWGGAGLVTSVQRSVARDTVQFAQQLAEFPSGGFISSLNSIGILIDTLLNSKFYRFTLVMAALGDKILQQGFFKPKPGLDDIPDNPIYRGGKVRSAKGSKALTYRAGNVQSMYILPTAFLVGAQKASVAGFVNSSILDNASLANKLFNPNSFLLPDGQPAVPETSARLPALAVEQIERELNSEYMPFYFHDLRTNEIVAFHAFLKDISDAFAANYNSSTGIGRIEPAYTYGGTTRSISLSFVILSTNPEDFDEMYYKINKLVTLVYPQFSRGRTVQAEDGVTFVQPFSQVQTSSPLVRIRLGNLLHSNYSRFSLARLFGLGQSAETFKPSASGGETADSDFSDAEKIANAERQVTELREPFGGFFPNDPVVIPAGTMMNVESTIPPGVVENDFTLPVAVKGTVGALPVPIDTSEGDPGTSAAAGAATAATPAAGSGGATSPELSIRFNVSVSLDQAGVSIVNANLEQQPVIAGSGYNVTLESDKLQLDPVFKSSQARLLAALPPQIPPPDPAADVAFFSADNNPIVRSFESTRGRGLAGVITSMNFDWSEATWSTDGDRKAPKMCSVSIQFNPIHDITPGLDADGFTRAPVYPAGNVMKAFGEVYDTAPEVQELDEQSQALGTDARRTRPT